MNLITTIDLKKTYMIGKDITIDVLKGINLEIEAGEFLAVVGARASGKTSLLNILCALDMPTSGKVLFENEDITEKTVNQLADLRLNKTGFVFKSYNLIDTLTVFENVEYLMFLRGIPNAERKYKVDLILKKVGLLDYVDRFPNEISLELQQCVAVARVVVAEPRVIFADEFTANLNSTTAGLLIDLMVEFNKKKGITFILSTYNPVVIKRAKRIVRLKNGVVLSS